MTTGDIASYEAKPRPPVCGTYRVYRICGMGPPSSGGSPCSRHLKQLERFDLSALGPQLADAWHLIAESSGSPMPTATAISATPISCQCRSRG